MENYEKILDLIESALPQPMSIAQKTLICTKVDKYAKQYHESELKNHGVSHHVSECDCPPLIACDICEAEKSLDGNFWKNKKKKRDGQRKHCNN